MFKEAARDKEHWDEHVRDARVFAQTFCPFATFAETLPVLPQAMSVDCGLDGVRCGHGTAFWRRGRRLRVRWRHEQLSIRMALESALHHSGQRPHRQLIDVLVQTCTWIDMSSTDKSDANDALSSETILASHERVQSQNPCAQF